MYSCVRMAPPAQEWSGFMLLCLPVWPPVFHGCPSVASAPLLLDRAAPAFLAFLGRDTFSGAGPAQLRPRWSSAGGEFFLWLLVSSLACGPTDQGGGIRLPTATAAIWFLKRADRRAERLIAQSRNRALEEVYTHGVENVSIWYVCKIVATCM